MQIKKKYFLNLSIPPCFYLNIFKFRQKKDLNLKKIGFQSYS